MFQQGLLEDAKAKRGHMVNERDFGFEKKLYFSKISNFAFRWYGRFPTRNGLKSRIAIQKYEKVNKVAV